jgi:hypothetical protein
MVISFDTSINSVNRAYLKETLGPLSAMFVAQDGVEFPIYPDLRGCWTRYNWTKKSRSTLARQARLVTISDGTSGDNLVEEKGLKGSDVASSADSSSTSSAHDQDEKAKVAPKGTTPARPASSAPKTERPKVEADKGKGKEGRRESGKGKSQSKPHGDRSRKGAGLVQTVGRKQLLALYQLIQLDQEETMTALLKMAQALTVLSNKIKGNHGTQGSSQRQDTEPDVDPRSVVGGLTEIRHFITKGLTEIRRSVDGGLGELALAYAGGHPRVRPPVDSSSSGTLASQKKVSFADPHQSDSDSSDSDGMFDARKLKAKAEKAKRLKARKDSVLSMNTTSTTHEVPPVDTGKDGGAPPPAGLGVFRRAVPVPKYGAVAPPESYHISKQDKRLNREEIHGLVESMSNQGSNRVTADAKPNPERAGKRSARRLG